MASSAGNLGKNIIELSPALAGQFVDDEFGGALVAFSSSTKFIVILSTPGVRHFREKNLKSVTQPLHKFLS